MLSTNFKLKIRSGESFLYRKEGTESQVFELRMRDKVSHFSLQRAYRKALKRFPYFNSSFKVKGESVYLVRNKVKPAVERRRNLRPLGGARTQKNMLDVTFYDKSIFVAFHHGMCDGRGIMPFIKTLMYYYLRRVYKLRDLHIPDVRLVGEEMLHGETSDPVRDGNFAFDPEKVFRVDRTGFELPGVDQEGPSPTLNYRYEHTFELDTFMRVCKEHNATPPILIAMLVQRAILDVCPLADKPITCFLTCDWREHIGLPNTFRNCVSSIYLPYKKDDHGKELQQLATEYRELIARQKELDSGRCSASIIKYLSDTLDKLSTYEEKSAMAERMAGMAANTFNLSYTGRANMGDAEQYIESIHPYMSGSKGICIQMMSIGDIITVDFLQSFASSMYVDAFCKQCRELGLKFTGTQAISFSTPRDHIRNKGFMKSLLQYLKH